MQANLFSLFAQVLTAALLIAFAPSATAQVKPASGTNTTQGATGVTQGGVRPSAATSPNTANVQRNATRGRATGDEDLEDLEIQRRTVQGIDKPGTTSPQLRPGAGTSPNVARQAGSAVQAPDKTGAMK